MTSHSVAQPPQDTDDLTTTRARVRTRRPAREQFPAGTRLLCRTNIGGFYEMRVIEWAPTADAVLVTSPYLGANMWMTSGDLSWRIVEVLAPVTGTAAQS